MGQGLRIIFYTAAVTPNFYHGIQNFLWGYIYFSENCNAPVLSSHNLLKTLGWFWNFQVSKYGKFIYVSFKEWPKWPSCLNIWTVLTSSLPEIGNRLIFGIFQPPYHPVSRCWLASWSLHIKGATLAWQSVCVCVGTPLIMTPRCLFPNTSFLVMICSWIV